MSEAGAGTDTVTAGTLLREAREAAGLHVATLAANLKVPVRKLEALEEDRFDQLGDAVFIRARCIGRGPDGRATRAPRPGAGRADRRTPCRRAPGAG